MNDQQLLRYARHLLLDEIGFEGQQKLLAAHALVLGAGGLGSPVALYLASAGVGRITLVDDDAVDLGNLQRQLLHTQARLGWPKVASAQAALAAINPEVQVRAVPRRADEALLRELAAQADVAVDCSDNFATRQALNRACVALRVPLVAGAAIGFEGQVSVHDVRQAQSPCYACLYRTLGLNDKIEDILVTLGKQYHITSPLRNKEGIFLYGVFDRAHANLALARSLDRKSVV